MKSCTGIHRLTVPLGLSGNLNFSEFPPKAFVEKDIMLQARPLECDLIANVPMVRERRRATCSLGLTSSESGKKGEGNGPAATAPAPASAPALAPAPVPASASESALAPVEATAA
uniref:Uncharacterized protein n=1 Tax=Vespula pensylvanica TaxID=30213 RepID=A0A834P6K3_VESPE|nr:hypothetical protein H0235_006333 [Vespula pensylvanica]